MAVNYNKVIIAGNLTRDPEVKFLANERAVANFSLAVNRKWRNAAGETQEETTFIDVEAWAKTAELVGQYLTKGKSALVEGRLKLDEWDKDGEKRQKLKVVADTVQFLSPRDGSDTGGESAPRSNPRPVAAAAESVIDDDDGPPF